MDGARTNGATRAIRIIAAILFIAMLYFAGEVLKPAAVAVLLAFLLHPLVARLARLGLNRGIAVGISVILATGVAGGLGFLVGLQFVDLSNKLPEYEGNLQHKVRSLRASGGPFKRFSHTLQDLNKEVASSQPTTTEPTAAASQAPTTEQNSAVVVKPVQVEVVNSGPTALDLLEKYAPPVLVPIATCGVVLLLLIFLLLHSDDVRERLVWFAGMRQISLTTAALDEAGQRIGGYLRMLAMVNFAYGLMIALCLWIIGLPNPFFWGALAGVLRFVPFLGPWIAAALPTLLGVAVFEGWRGPLEIVLAFVVVELITNMVLEPILYGRSTGISSLGIVVAAVFWAWLWGPIGLILSVPLTVCLLVIGKQVPQLSVLNHLFGENVEMPKPVRLYQRVLVGDDVTAAEIIDEEMKRGGFFEVCQTLLIPVLQELKRDLQSGMVEIAQARRAMSILDITATPETPPVISTKSDQSPLLFVAGQNEIDDMAATLLARASAAEGVPAEMVSSRSLASEVVERARELSVNTLCLVQVAPISWTHCRHLSKMLSARLPSTTVYAVNLESPEIEAPFKPGTAHLPAKKLYRDVKSLMERVREMRFVEAEKPSATPVTAK